MNTQEWDIPGRPGMAAGGSGQALALELVRVTEAAAIAAGEWVGFGDGNSGEAAAHVMRELLGSVRMRGVVVAGADGKGATPVLFAGDDVGSGDGPACDVAITAGDGALSPVKDVPYSLSAIAVAERGALFDPSPGASMEKLAVGPECVDVVDIRRPVAENLRAVAKAKDIRVSDVVVAVLNRPYHRDLVHEIRDAGARIHLLEGGEVSGAIAVARPESPVDILLGAGGAAEGVIAAAALTCSGGALQARLQEGKVLHTEDLVGGENILFCATGLTGSELLRGVQHHSGRVFTQSLVMSSKPETVRMVRSERPHVARREQEGRRTA
ncbi:fructose-bisphosphatase class II [Amycolatopsis sp. CB00013]|uniref:fructose-bisphosphatase class II n=1 Tax=Amycolatopsis sp. CB00013 TaxID=1703945 RepID=UPI0009F8338C|nr:fructose-bisphosphatase class II [Amycolatopsis sp. CB00013]